MTWRPFPPPGEGPDGVRPVRDSLGRVTRALGVPDAGVLGTLFEHWERLVGASVAAHARPVSLRDGLLTVAVDDPAWATQLTYLEADLRRRIEAELGEGTVDRVAVRIRRPGRR